MGRFKVVGRQSAAWWSFCIRVHPDWRLQWFIFYIHGGFIANALKRLAVASFPFCPSLMGPSAHWRSLGGLQRPCVMLMKAVRCVSPWLRLSYVTVRGHLQINDMITGAAGLRSQHCSKLSVSCLRVVHDFSQKSSPNIQYSIMIITVGIIIIIIISNILTFLLSSFSFAHSRIIHVLNRVPAEGDIMDSLILQNYYHLASSSSYINSTNILRSGANLIYSFGHILLEKCGNFKNVSFAISPIHIRLNVNICEVLGFILTQICLKKICHKKLKSPVRTEPQL